MDRPPEELRFSPDQEQQRQQRREPPEASNLWAWKLFICALAYANVWALFGHEALPPDGVYFHLVAIFVAAHVAGQLSKLFHLPPLFGMLLAGFAYGNALDLELNTPLTSILRSLALMVILLRAGLNLDPVAIKRLSFLCIRLSLIPCLVEAGVLALVAYFIFGLNVGWSLLLGFVVASVSPAIVVPCMIRFQETRLGTNKGIPSLLIAASSVDNVLAITGFSVCFSLAFATTNPEKQAIPDNEQWNLVMAVARGPAEAALGVSFGLVVGLLIWFLPERCNSAASDKYDVHRFLALLLTGMFALFGAEKLDLGGSGPLAILVVAFIASLKWTPAGLNAYQERSLKYLWVVLEHYLFALIAADVRVKTLESSVLLYGVLCLGVALLARMAAAYLVTYGNGLSYKERCFIAIAWVPKASVQAAIGSLALEAAITGEDIQRGRLVLTLAVLSIILTAPVGAIAIDLSSRCLLERDDAESRRAQRKRLQQQQQQEQNVDETTALLVY